MEENNNIIRPMLNITTEMVNAYIDYNNLIPVYDETNSDIKYVRNRIRHKLIPVLYDCGAEFEKTVCRLQKESLKLKEYFDSKTKHAIKYVEKFAVIDKEKFLLLEDIEKEFLLGKVFSIFFRVSKNIINETLSFFSGNHSKRLDLPNGYMVEQSFRNIRIFPRYMVEDFSYTKKVFDSVLQTDDFTIKFSGDYTNKELIVRNRRKGDKLKNKKLKDIFIDKHMELFDRDRAVIVEDNGLIIWVENITKNNNITIIRNGIAHG